MKEKHQHILFWILFLFFETYLEFTWVGIEFKQSTLAYRLSRAFAVEALYLLIKIPFVYISLYTINRLKRNIFVYTILFLLLLFVSSIAHRFLTAYIILPLVYNQTTISQHFDFGRYITSLIDLAFILSLMVGFNYYNVNEKLKRKQNALVKEKLVSELSLLKSQINPHFLFNTLNNLYLLTKKDAEKASTTVMHLSTLLRFMLYESSKNRITVKQEIEILSHYINLEKIRYSDELNININIDIDDEEQLIPPLLLLPLIENAFKHGASESSGKTDIQLNLTIKEYKLNFLLINTIEDVKEKSEDKIGLTNVKRQLQLLFKEYSMHTIIEENRFKLDLVINLDSYEEI